MAMKMGMPNLMVSRASSLIDGRAPLDGAALASSIDTFLTTNGVVSFLDTVSAMVV
jgi:hypothetical protein